MQKKQGGPELRKRELIRELTQSQKGLYSEVHSEGQARISMRRESALGGSFRWGTGRRRGENRTGKRTRSLKTVRKKRRKTPVDSENFRKEGGKDANYYIHHQRVKLLI